MQTKLKSLWVKALRGEGDKVYEQGKHHLKCGDKMCCLGVLCDVLGSEWVLFRDGFYKDGDVYQVAGSDGCHEFPPTEIIKKIGDTNTAEILSDMNDIQKKNFYEIANWVEENL